MYILQVKVKNVLSKWEPFKLISICTSGKKNIGQMKISQHTVRDVFDFSSVGLHLYLTFI